MNFRFFLVLTLALFSTTVFSQESAFLRKVHYGVFDPSGTPVGDILYLHGYGDTFENHLPLFEVLNNKGLRVVTFDFPSHGKSIGGIMNDLRFYEFEDLAELAGKVWKKTSSGVRRPFFLMGWSTGGLLATRMTQVERMRKNLPEIKGLLTFAPAVSPKVCVGNSTCHITNDTLTHNPQLQRREITPKTPFTRPAFAAKLMLNSQLAWKQPISENLPVMVIVASDTQDFYVNTPGVKNWIGSMNKRFHSGITGIQCPKARHELDNEPEEFGGKQVRELTAKFFEDLATGKNFIAEAFAGPCVTL